MSIKILYTAEAVSTGDGRNGHVATSDGRLDLDLAMPPALGGTGEGANPEQLFASGYAACFHSALRLVARQSDADMNGSSVTARVSIGTEDQGAVGLAVTLLIHLPDVAPGTAEELARSAHAVCPYSRATRGNIHVDLRVLP
ncbi:organic hydroperoxide resistance protein [Catellatospora tritici]|uniref:organic hydroperoxide resistance protein n=1 Tax=Catellatospora tritici TaxID=2851566 RepID=UPI001C2D46D5|nr:organic hydroperoxide resistance protein [Catellatospora tritici]MBV1856393.1 organic hydroperoxide resistance protein [Catellatospora tritici]